MIFFVVITWIVLLLNILGAILNLWQQNNFIGFVYTLMTIIVCVTNLFLL